MMMMMMMIDLFSLKCMMSSVARIDVKSPHYTSFALNLTVYHLQYAT
jgi:hypothetical protein